MRCDELENTNELLYSEDGNAARYVFLKQYNDINFFVEDKDKEYQYEEILQRMFGNEYDVKYIFSTGGKEHLKERFNEFGKVDPDNPKKINIYIADGDFDAFLHRDGMINDENFLYLRTYNIENYYIDETAVIRFMAGALHMRQNEVKEFINFKSWLEEILEYAKKIFFYYCYMQKYYYDVQNVPNVSIGPKYFIDEKTGFAREGALERFVVEMNEKHAILLDERKAEFLEIKSSYEAIYGDSYFELICGKFLLWSLYSYLESKLPRKNMDYKVLEWDLIRNFDINKLLYLKDKIVYAISLAS